LTVGTAVANGPGTLAVYRTTRWSTSVELVVTDPRAVAAASVILNRELDRVEQVASRFRPDSEINRLHSAAAHPSGWAHPVSDDLFEAVSLAVRAAALSDGAVDPTVGSALCALGYDRDFSALADGVSGRLPAARPVPGWQTVVVDSERRAIGLLPGTVLDLGATAKAWAADRAGAAIADQLGCGTLVSLGGDIAVGNAPDGGFTIGIADVCGDRTTTVQVSIEAGGLATSGIGRRHWLLGGHEVHHLVDPDTGLPVHPYWRTVSVAAGSCLDANTASTAAMVKGVGAVTWLERVGLPARLVRTDGLTVTAAGWPSDPGGGTRPDPARP
jgi:thiamine biosynthesis lipoprotein ApbE